MQYQELFVEFWKQVEESVEAGEFAKLTLAKTIGKPNLRNIFVRPVYSENDFKVLVKLRYRDRDTQDIETEESLASALELIKPYLQKSFLSVLLFTTTKDVMFKINRKGAGTIVENQPTFRDIIQAQKD